MSRFNNKAVNPRKTVNHEGEVAYKLSDEMSLYTQVCTASLQPKFYQSSTDQIYRLRSAIKKVDPRFVCKLAIYAREKMNLRSIPLVLLCELFKSFDNGTQIGRKDSRLLRYTVTRVIQRADEITEILSYFATINSDNKAIKKLNKIPNAMKKGIADAFHKFDEYQFSKYNRNNEIKLKDALFLTHPNSLTYTHSVLFKKIANDKLETPYTWEVELSNLGKMRFNSATEKRSAFASKWEQLVMSGKLGYMAILRNLRGMLQYGVSEKTVNEVCKILSDPVAVKRSRQLPFRFWSAYRSLGHDPVTSYYGVSSNREDFDAFSVNKISKALEKAVKISVENVKGFDSDTKVLIASDISGSMIIPVSSNSQVMYYDIGLLLGQLLSVKCENVVTGLFGDVFKPNTISGSDILSNMTRLYNIQNSVGFSTNGYRVIEWLDNRNITVDKVMMFTDCQMWDSTGWSKMLSGAWNKYRQKNPDAKMYLFDLKGYDSYPIDIVADNSVYLISGWSEKIFEVMDAIENGGSVINYLKNELSQK